MKEVTILIISDQIATITIKKLHLLIEGNKISGNYSDAGSSSDLIFPLI